MTDNIKELVERLQKRTRTFGIHYTEVPDEDCIEAASALLSLSGEVERMTRLLEAQEFGTATSASARAALERLAINQQEISNLAAENERMRGALEEIAKPTYGTDFCNTQEENNAILAPHVFWYQNIARAALGKDTPDERA